jgi:CHASE2 domain-containing sensor protein
LAPQHVEIAQNAAENGRPRGEDSPPSLSASSRSRAGTPQSPRAQAWRVFEQEVHFWPGQRQDGGSIFGANSRPAIDEQRSVPPMNATKNASPSPVAKTVGAAAASLVMGLFVCGFTYLLRALDFAPLRALIVAEDQLYDAFHAPEIHLLPNARRVVFIDIDDNAVEKWNTQPDNGPQSPEAPQPLPNNTPRGLIARLTNLARQASAAVVYLDFDFRNHLPDRDGDGDGDLDAELAKVSDTPALIPTFFTSGRLPPCNNQTDRTTPAELETIFSDLTKPRETGSGKSLPSVALVHPVLALGAYGLPDGACSAYRVQFMPGGEIVSREAAMVRAVELACKPSEQCIKAPDLASPEIVPIRWTIGNDTDQKRDSGDNAANNDGANDENLAYARIKASSLVKYQSLVDSPSMDLSVLKDAIVVIGSTARWSEDTLSTPLGDLQGVLAHVNLALSLESSSNEVPLWKQLGLDVVFTVLATAVTIPLCWLATFRSLSGGARLSLRQRLRRLFLEACVFAGCGLLFAIACWLLAQRWNVLAGWRFGLLSFIVGAIVVFLIEVCSAVSEGAKEAMEDFMMWWSVRNPKMLQRREPAGNATESTPP